MIIKNVSRHYLMAEQLITYGLFVTRDIAAFDI